MSLKEGRTCREVGNCLRLSRLGGYYKVRCSSVFSQSRKWEDNWRSSCSYRVKNTNKMKIDVLAMI